MSCILICNTGSDTLSIFNIEKERTNSFVFNIGEKPFGPHGICTYKNYIMTANCYNNTISVIERETLHEKKKIDTAPHPNDVVCVNDKIYTVCGDGNCIYVYNMRKNQLEYEISVGNFPHNICADKANKFGIITNMGEESISIIDFEENKLYKKINVGRVPIKSVLSWDGKYIYIIISNLGYEVNGKILIFELRNMEILKEIEVGKGPVDVFEYNSRLYVSNFLDESISIINIKSLEKEKRYIIKNSMPKGIIVHNNKIYCGDYYYGMLHVIDLISSKKKSIAIGKEPNAMIFKEN